MLEGLSVLRVNARHTESWSHAYQVNTIVTFVLDD
jgi:hypothetical protein